MRQYLKMGWLLNSLDMLSLDKKNKKKKDNFLISKDSLPPHYSEPPTKINKGWSGPKMMIYYFLSSFEFQVISDSITFTDVTSILPTLLEKVHLPQIHEWHSVLTFISRYIQYVSFT